jgi:hypothetical protein
MNAVPEISLPGDQAASLWKGTGWSALKHVVRAALFIWTAMIACPVRYWPVEATVDNAWVFALNYAAAHGLAIGRDIVWTTGPLGYLVFPQDIGANLAHALVFQGAIWAILIAIFADLFYCAGVSLRNLGFFTIFFSLSAPLYWFNYMGVENLLLAAVLILLVITRRRGGLGRYVVALVLAGLIPLIKLTGGLLACGAVLGFLVDRAIRVRKQAKREIILALIVPLAAAGIGCWLLLPSVDSLIGYLRSSIDIAGGYSSALSLSGDPVELGGVVEIGICIAVLLLVRTKSDRAMVWFFLALLTIPLLISVKHGFTRQDEHVINFFSFAGLALGLINLGVPARGARIPFVLLVLWSYALISTEYMIARVGFRDAVGEVTGWRAPALAWKALSPTGVRAALHAEDASFPVKARVEPEIRSIVGNSPVASLSVVYSGAWLDGLNLKLYPVIQRYSAYTPYLDGLNAAFIREKGPRFLLFDGYAVDGRQPWTETPATWLEIYRWYNTRLLGAHSLLLERRSAPRFEQLRPIGHVDMPITSRLDFSASKQAVFWTLRCGTNFRGRLQKMFLDVPEVTMRLGPEGTRFRIIPEVMESPMLAEQLPSTLSQFASVLDDTSARTPRVSTIDFGGRGLASYGPDCQVDFLAP